MKIKSALLLVLGLLPFGGRSVMGQAIFTVTGTPASLTISTTVPGTPLLTAADASTTYFVRIKPTEGVKKITAQLNSPMPANTTLQITMAPPFGATSLGPVTLTGASQDIVVNMSKINPGSTQSITYTFSATPAAGVVLSQSRIVTLTMLDYP